MNYLIAFLKLTWFWLLCVGLGVWVFLNLPLDELSWVGKTVSFVICIIVLPLVAQGVYMNAMWDENLAESFRNIRFGCVTFLLGFVLWTNLPLEEVSSWVKLLLGAILFVAFPFLVQMVVTMLSDTEKKE